MISLFNFMISLFNFDNLPLSIRACILFSSSILTFVLALFIFLSPGQAASRRMRPTSPPTWRPSLRCRRRGHLGRRPGSQLQRGGARSGPSKPLSSPRSDIRKQALPIKHMQMLRVNEHTSKKDGSLLCKHLQAVLTLTIIHAKKIETHQYYKKV